MKKRNIPTDLTFQDFQRLAERQPNLEGNWIYRLVRTKVDAYDETYPKFDLFEDEHIWFMTFQEAVERIRKIVVENDCDDDYQTYNFYITQFPLGCAQRHGAQWLYDSQGNLLDYTITTWTGDVLSTSFFGRSDKRCRFKRGDIVEVAMQEEVKLAILVEDPPSPEWCWKVYKHCMNEEYGSKPYVLNASDDCCFLINDSEDGYPILVSPLQMMHPRLPIPEIIEKKLKDLLRYFDEKTQE